MYEKTTHKVPNKVPNKLLEAFPEIQAMTWNVYNMLRADNHLTTALVAEALGISDRMVRKHLTTLKEKGLISRIGSNKTGYWEISDVG